MLLRFLLSVFLLGLTAHAKRSRGVAQLTGEKTEQFLTKFAFSLGQGTINATFYTLEPYIENSRSLNLYIYCDEEWEQAKTVYTCVEKAKLARTTIMLDLNMASSINLTQALTKSTGLAIDGAEYVERTLDHFIRTHYWYFFLADCSLEQVNHQVPPIYYDLSIMNKGGKHLPADEKGLWEIYFFSFCLQQCAHLLGTKHQQDNAGQKAVFLQVAVHIGLNFEHPHIRHIAVYLD